MFFPRWDGEGVGGSARGSVLDMLRNKMNVTITTISQHHQPFLSSSAVLLRIIRAFFSVSRLIGMTRPYLTVSC